MGDRSSVYLPLGGVGGGVAVAVLMAVEGADALASGVDSAIIRSGFLWIREETRTQVAQQPH